MKVFYSDRPLEIEDLDLDPGIFLAGPTPRDKVTQSWRPTALQILEKYNFSGKVFVPERGDKTHKIDYDDQVEWERRGLNNATHILFWVPRKFPEMPALTTNAEFGYYIAKSPDKVYYGRPDNSEKNRYLDWMYIRETGRKPKNNLIDLIDTCLLNL